MPIGSIPLLMVRNIIFGYALPLSYCLFTGMLNILWSKTKMKSSLSGVNINFECWSEGGETIVVGQDETGELIELRCLDGGSRKEVARISMFEDQAELVVKAITQYLEWKNKNNA